MKNAILSFPALCPSSGTLLRLPALSSHAPRSWLPEPTPKTLLRKLRLPVLAGQTPLQLGGRSWWGAFWGRDGWDVATIVGRDEARLIREIRAAHAAHRPVAPIALGGAGLGDDLWSDPYSPDRAPATTATLETLDRYEGLAISLSTRQPRVLEDLDLLTHLDGKHAVTVTVPLESDAPASEARLQTVKALAARGLAVRILVVPRSAPPRDTQRLERLFAAAAAAGAQDVQTRWDPLPTIFERLRLAHGFPQPVAGRG